MKAENQQIILLGYYASDALVAKQAWMSTAKDDDNVEHIKKVIEFIVKNVHEKPLEVCSFHFEFRTPISIDRQAVTYRTFVAPLANSGRYGSTPGSYFVPDFLAEGLEQNNEDLAQIYQETIDYVLEKCKYIEDQLILRGCKKRRAREIVRFLHPQAENTNRKFVLNLRNLLHFLEERLSHHAQVEIQDLARMMLEQVKPVLPITFEAIKNSDRYPVLKSYL